MDPESYKQAHRNIKAARNEDLRQLLDAGMDPNNSNKLGWTLLMLAALEGNTMAGELLIEHGADINATNSFGESALMHAAHKGHTPFIKLLFGKEALLPAADAFTKFVGILRVSTGLPDTKVESIIQLLNNHRRAGA